MYIGLAMSVIIVAGLVYFFRKGLKTSKVNISVPDKIRQLLEENVAFYKNLDDAGKASFELRVKGFLSTVAIKGIEVEVEDLDRVLVAAGAIIPIFAFKDWTYNNIWEVLLYKGTFSKEYSTDDAQRYVLGMVGDGAMHHEMILSQPSLRSSFQHSSDGHNTAIHEFAHLIDKADGSTDGMPEYLLTNPYVIPWVTRMHDTINEMKRKNHSDIDQYGATNDAEFFAVISEYFFEKPEQLKERHPELYDLLEMMFSAK
jgi:MtfA peptidase